MKSRTLLRNAILLALGLGASSQAYAQNLAAGKPIVDGSGSWSQAPNDIVNGPFPPGKVTDGLTNDTDETSYWLGNEGANNQYFVIDLGSSQTFNRIDLQNTHNRQYNDRGSNNFTVSVSNSPFGPFTPVISSALSRSYINNGTVVYPGTIPHDIYDIAPVNARYVRYEAIDFTGASSGLNELYVYNNMDNLALHRTVIAGTGTYFANGNINTGYDGVNSFSGGNVTDGSTGDVFGKTYWLGREGVPQESFTVDLGNVKRVDELRLRNTHNDPYQDRGTDAFEVWGSNHVDVNNNLVGGSLVVASNLSNFNGLGLGQNEIPADIFNAGNGLNPGNYRYLQFKALSANNPFNNVGLNEFEAYGSHLPVPQATVSAFTGGDAGEGLDLQGNFLYAVSSTPTLFPFTVDGATFYPAGLGAPAINSVNQILYWDNRPEYGGTPNDDNLEEIMHSINWTADGQHPANGNVEVSAPVEAGKTYKLQLLFTENIANWRRAFNVNVEGFEVASDLVATDIHANWALLGFSGPFAGMVVTYEFTAGDNMLNFLLTPGAGAPLDANPTLSAWTLEVIPVPGAAWAGLALLGSMGIMRRNRKA